MAVTLLCALASGCGMFGFGSQPERQPTPPPAFVDRVWVTADGTRYVFVSDNTLRITPVDAAAPLLGRWHHAAGGIVLIEEGFRYPADILEQGPERFAIRVHRPEGMVDIVMTAAR